VQQSPNKSKQINLTQFQWWHSFSCLLETNRKLVFREAAMTIPRIVCGVALAAVAMGGLAAPTPAFATIEELRECLHNCYIAYVVETQQPAFYQMCAHHCIVLYDNFAAVSVDAPQAVTRYS
jgi:hypothetical protein